MNKSFPVVFGNRGTIVDVKYESGNTFKFSYNIPGCGCTCFLTAHLDRNFEDVNWELIKKDIIDFLKSELVEYTSLSGKLLSVNYCEYCGNKLPEI